MDTVQGQPRSRKPGQGAAPTVAEHGHGCVGRESSQAGLDVQQRRLKVADRGCQSLSFANVLGGIGQLEAILARLVDAVKEGGTQNLKPLASPIITDGPNMGVEAKNLLNHHQAGA